MICLGRPAANESFTHGSVRQSLMLTREGLPLLHEVLRFEGGDALQKCACGLGDQAVSATLFAVGRATDDGQDLAALEACCTTLQNMLSPNRDFDDAPDGTPDDASEGPNPAARDSTVQARPVPLSAHMGERAGATVRGEVLVVRYLGPDMEEARNLLLTAWNLLRPSLTGCPPHMPRIWYGAF